MAPNGNAAEAIQAGRLAAPIAGINGNAPYSMMGAQDLIYGYNVVPSEKGLRTRKGTKEWVTGLTGDVRSLVPFYAESSANDKLFAVTSQGIYDVTATAASPAIKVTFGTTGSNAGWGTYAYHVTDAGVKSLLFADEVNGLYTYTPGTDTWAVTAGITGATAANIVHIVVHKQRIWLTERNSVDPWYLPVGAVAGAATRFYLGGKFKAGGYLTGIYNWTLDGGEGVDDYCVFLSRSGDVAVYRGTDPSSASTWEIKGLWQIGTVPLGRRGVGTFEGHLHILSVYGLVSLTTLMQGASVQSATEGHTNEVARIGPLVRASMSSYLNTYGWEIKNYLAEGCIVVARPYTADSNFQLVYNENVRGWGSWRSLPYNCGHEFNGAFYQGSTAGVVYKDSVYQDLVPRTASTGTDIPFSILTAYSDMDSPARFKRVQFIRPRFLSEFGGTPAFNATARYDYDLAEVTSVPGSPAATGSLWDVALWDSAIWGGGALAGGRIIGSSGMGVVAAVALRGTTADRVALLDFDVMYDVGGFL